MGDHGRHGHSVVAYVAWLCGNCTPVCPVGGHDGTVHGAFGKGKSTVAALCCAAGGELVSDDVVAIGQSGSAVTCRGIGKELRFRDSAREIAGLFLAPGPARRTTADGRLALKPTAASSDHNTISAVVLPQPGRHAQEVGLQPLGPAEAVVKLLGNARVPAMLPLDWQRRNFEVVSDLAGKTNVVEATMPWGPPFAVSAATMVQGTCPRCTVVTAAS